MKTIHVLLFLLAIRIPNILEGQSSYQQSNPVPQNTQEDPYKKPNPLQKRANEELFHQRKFVNDCNLVMKADCPIPMNYISNFVDAYDGKTYTASTTGIKMWDGYANISITTDNARIPENNITALALDNEDHLWIGTYSSGIVIGTGNDIKPFKIQHVQTHNLYVVSIYVDGGRVWVAYKNGGLECFLNGISCKYFSPP